MIRAGMPSSGDMRRPLQLLVIGLAAVVVGLMAVGYAFIFRGVATAPDSAPTELEVPALGRVVATALDDGTPVFAVNLPATLAVLDARAPAGAGAVPMLVAWCEEISMFETGRTGEGDVAGTLGFEPDGASLGPFQSPGLTRYAVSQSGDRMIVLGTTTQARGRIDRPPDCPAGSDRVLHRPEEGEVFDPSVAAESEPPGVIWLEGTLRAVGNQALLCDELGDASGDCASGAVARGIDPASIPAAGTSGLFIGVVRDGGITGLAHAGVLSEMEKS